MSIAEIQQRAAFIAEPIGEELAPAGIPVPSSEPYTAETHYADFFTAHPDLAQQIWQDAAQEVLEPTFDPRAIYTAAFNARIAARTARQNARMPSKPTNEVLDMLGATSMFTQDIREYYQATGTID